jgi:hypothetical protein
MTPRKLTQVLPPTYILQEVSDTIKFKDDIKAINKPRDDAIAPKSMAPSKNRTLVNIFKAIGGFRSFRKEVNQSTIETDGGTEQLGSKASGSGTA